MRPIEIEIWANSILDSLERAGPTEDHRVELKREWIDGRAAARRLAGHANSAPDDNILWLIGVDEKAGKVIGVQQQDLAGWWPSVEAEFADRVAPEMTAVNMMRDGTPLVALAFKTDRAPYLVRNPEFGSSGHSIAWEVPFRVGTAVRTATRNQLLSLLSPSLPLPRQEIVKASVALYKPEREDRWVQRCVVDVVFYLVAPTRGGAITLDARASEVTVEIPGLLPPAALGIPQLKPASPDNVGIDGVTYRFTGTVLMHLKVEGKVPSIGSNHAEQLRLMIKLRPIGFERNLTFACTLNSQATNPISGVTHSFQMQGSLLR